MLQPGDVLVSNFNNSSNLQGTGTTIVRITPGGQQSVFYQGPPGVGLSTALGVLQGGYVIVGAVPSTDGTSATARAGGLLVLNSSGKVVANLTDPKLLDGPWDMAITDSGRTAKIFVSDVLSGTVTRFDVKLTSSGFQVAEVAQIASGYTHRGDPAAFEIGRPGSSSTPSRAPSTSPRRGTTPSTRSGAPAPRGPTGVPARWSTRTARTSTDRWA